MVSNINESEVLPWAISSNFRSGKIGNWKDEFDSENIKKFKELSDEEKENSQSIQWHDLDDYGMGWEIGRGIGYFHDWEGHMPSRRLIKWWWRLNQIGGWSDEKLMLWAKKYEEYEIKTAFGIKSERNLLKTIGGDCHTAVGAYAKIDKGNITIISQLFSDDGLKSFSIKKSGDKKFPEQLGISAGKDLLKKSEGNYKKKR